MYNNTARGVISDAIRGFLITLTLLALCLAFMSTKANAATAHEHTGSGDYCSECGESLGPEMCSECGEILDASWECCENCDNPVDYRLSDIAIFFIIPYLVVIIVAISKTKGEQQPGEGQTQGSSVP